MIYNHVVKKVCRIWIFHFFFSCMECCVSEREQEQRVRRRNGKKWTISKHWLMILGLAHTSSQAFSWGNGSKIDLIDGEIVVVCGDFRYESFTPPSAPALLSLDWRKLKRPPIDLGIWSNFFSLSFVFFFGHVYTWESIHSAHHRHRLEEKIFAFCV